MDGGDVVPHAPLACVFGLNTGASYVRDDHSFPQILLVEIHAVVTEQDQKLITAGLLLSYSS
jgi:hypothetical protein